MNDRNQHPTKAAATVRDVARMVGLSPARFYQLQQAGVFPMPVYDIRTRRPHYTEEQQRECLEVRRRNCGINGKAVLFYARRPGMAAPTPARRSAKAHPAAAALRDDGLSEVVDGLKALGLKAVTATQVGLAVKEIFPTGRAGPDPGEVIRAVFMHLRRQDSADNVGR